MLIATFRYWIMMIFTYPLKGTIIPNMGKILIQESAGALFGKVRRRLLTLLLLDPDESFNFREIRDKVESGSGAVHREIANLVEAGILTRREMGNQTRYQANRDSAIFSELRSLFLKTSGVPELLRKALKPINGRTSLAFIFGSYAEGTLGTGSDIDLMVVGDVGFSEVAVALQAVQNEIGREINPAVYSPASLKERKETGFIMGVLQGEKIFLKGGMDELEEMVG